MKLPGAVNEGYLTDGSTANEDILRRRSIHQKEQQKRSALKRIKFAWFCLKNYYTAPVNKFVWYMVSGIWAAIIRWHLV